MQLIENLRLAFLSLAANKMRALLTMLGIIIGISAVITITTIGSSIQKTLTNTFNSLGNMNYFEVFVEMDLDSGSDNANYSEEDLITRSMLDELVETYPDYFSLSLSENFGVAELRNVKEQSFNAALNGLMDSNGFDLLRGRGISFEDNVGKKHAILVSDLFVEQYFAGTADPIGQTITLNLQTGQSLDFVIVGVYKLPEIYSSMVYQPGMKEIDKITPIYVPLDTITNILHQENSYYSYVEIYYNTEYDHEMLEETLQEFFDEKYAQKPAFYCYIVNAQTQLGMINAVINVITIAISIIAAISLIVGGVGVMNIMLVSITERTKEIGIRKALGAQNSSIRMQFVIEAILICLIGGIIGIMLGIFNGLLIGWIAKSLVESMYSEYASLFAITIRPSVTAIIISVLFSMLTGVFFGYYPANKAAKMNPIDALRYD